MNIQTVITDARRYVEQMASFAEAALKRIAEEQERRIKAEREVAELRAELARANETINSLSERHEDFV